MDINWDEAPEGATHYCIGSTHDTVWRDLSGVNAKYWSQGRWHDHHGVSSEFCLKYGVFEERPTQQAWDGKGLPPVWYLRERLSYDRETGRLVWLPRLASDFTEKHHYVSWVSRCEGKEAGVIVTKKRKKYRRIEICGKKMYAHRVAWAIHYGEHPDEEIDHINGDSMDNSIANLRKVSRQENCRNVKLHAGSRSGYCGVNWHEETGKWRARVKINGKEKYIGLFNDPLEAAERIKTLRETLGFNSGHGAPHPQAEQIAAEEREKVINQMEWDGGADLSSAERILLEKLYDAGYRKQENNDAKA